ncbi:hypothetical protein SBA3_3800001 [Candidatus Sulfopaludibacter sp. SbA3]|nr:hypothetical protein SBA3_3800001 [Candidatus Sulfopaludibacter sp. SbA3]
MALLAPGPSFIPLGEASPHAPALSKMPQRLSHSATKGTGDKIAGATRRADFHPTG